MVRRLRLFIGFIFIFSTFCYSQEKIGQDTLVVIDTLIVYDTVSIPKRTIIEEKIIEKADSTLVDSNSKTRQTSTSKFSFFKEISIITADYEYLGIQSNISYKSYYLLLTTGTNFNLATPLVAGIGVGKKINLFATMYLSPELVSIWYFPFGRDYSAQSNQHLRIGIAYKISPKFAIKITPSIYCGWKNNVANNKEYNEIIHIMSLAKPFYAEERSSNATFDIGAGCSLELIYKLGNID